jgi:transposase
VERQLQAIEALTLQIKEADRELKRVVKDDSVCRRMMTVPGVGPVTALRFVAAVDDVSRFSNAHQLESYLGVVPGQDSSSERKRITGITKAGSNKVRWALTQASWSARRRYRADPMVLWSIGVEQRRGKFVATIALARKMAGVMFALWRDGTTYDARRTAKTVQA